jgi:hypothetical protein
MKRRGTIRYIDLQPESIPPNCSQIVITQNKTKIIIKSDHALVDTSVANKQALILKKIKAFFNEEKNFQRVKPLLLQTCKLSLRLLDWSTTNWSKKNSVGLVTTRNGFEERINMYLDYKAHLKAFSKRSFDPFCRRERIMLQFDPDPERRTYISTAAQMNFFKWAIESGVLEYCETHLEEIERDMVSSLHVKINHQKDNITKKMTFTTGARSVCLT